MSLRDSLLDAMPRPVRLGLRMARRQALFALRSVSRPSIVTHRGIRLGVGPHMSPRIRQAVYSGHYEGGELTAIRRYLTAGDRVLEVGTGIGFTTLYCARIVGDENVFTYEANPANEPHIRNNFRLNKMNPTLQIGLLGAESGECELFVEENYWSSSTTRRSSSATPLTVPQLPVAEEMRRIRPNVIIMDIEGGEYELLPLLDLAGVDKLVLELHPHIIGEDKTQVLRDLVEEAGFECGWSCEDRNHLCYLRTGAVG